MFLKFQRFSASDIRIHFSTKMMCICNYNPASVHADGLTRSIISCHHPWDERTCDAWAVTATITRSYWYRSGPLSHHKVPPLPIRNRLKCWRFDSNDSYKLVSLKRVYTLFIRTNIIMPETLDKNHSETRPIFDL